MDDIEKLNRVLQRSAVTENKRAVGGGAVTRTGGLLDGEVIPDDPRICYHRTHRCHHAAHAYTGIPCAAYCEQLEHSYDIYAFNCLEEFLVCIVTSTLEVKPLACIICYNK